MQTHQSVTKDIHRPRIPAVHNGLSKARGCLWHSLANWEDKMLRFQSRSVADLGDGPGPQLFWVKKEEMTEGKKASSASKSRPPSPSWNHQVGFLKNDCLLSIPRSPRFESGLRVVPVRRAKAFL